MNSSWSLIEQFAVQMALTLLKLVIKSPAANKTEGAVISQIAQLATQADTAVNGSGWSYTAPVGLAKG